MSGSNEPQQGQPNKIPIIQKPSRTIPHLGNKTVDGDLIPFSINPVPSVKRISIVETIVHQVPRHNPTIIETRLSNLVKSDEEPYFRPRLKVGKEWIKIETGWLDGSTEDKEVGRIIIKNHGPDRETGGVIGKEEKDKIALMYLEICMNPDTADGYDDAYILVGDSLRICSGHIEYWRIRCPNGVTRISILALPS